MLDHTSFTESPTRRSNWLNECERVSVCPSIICIHIARTAACDGVVRFPISHRKTTEGQASRLSAKKNGETTTSKARLCFPCRRRTSAPIQHRCTSGNSLGLLPPLRSDNKWKITSTISKHCRRLQDREAQGG